MTTIGMYYDVIPGKESQFKDSFVKVVEHLKTVAGHVESHLYEDVATAGSFLIRKTGFTVGSSPFSIGGSRLIPVGPRPMFLRSRCPRRSR